MSLPTKQYPPPATWEEFESLCADLYERVWKDPATERHGRQGQPQGGVDIYGRPDGKSYTGVQCKKKDIWPAKELTAWPAPGLDDTDLSESGSALELHGA